MRIMTNTQDAQAHGIMKIHLPMLLHGQVKGILCGTCVGYSGAK